MATGQTLPHVWGEGWQASITGCPQGSVSLTVLTVPSPLIDVAGQVCGVSQLEALLNDAAPYAGCNPCDHLEDTGVDLGTLLGQFRE